MQGSTVKELASAARRRMLHGYTDANRFVCTAARKNTEHLPLFQSDEILTKIYEIVQSGDEMLNPISQLIDKEYFASLTPEEQQRYVLKLSEAYICVKKFAEQARTVSL